MRTATESRGPAVVEVHTSLPRAIVPRHDPRLSPRTRGTPDTSRVDARGARRAIRAHGDDLRREPRRGAPRASPAWARPGHRGGGGLRLRVGGDLHARG